MKKKKLKSLIKDHLKDAFKEAILELELPYEYLNGKWWKVISFKENKDLDWAEFHSHPKGGLICDLCYYNGGGHWTELVENYMKKQREASPDFEWPWEKEENVLLDII